MNKKLVAFFLNKTAPVIYNENDGIDFWRERLLLSISLVINIFAVIAYIPSVILAFSVGLWEIAVVDTLAYLIVIFIFFSKKRSVPIRSWLLILLSFFLGLFLLYKVGALGAGYVWIIAAPILAALLLNVKDVVIVNILAAISLLVYGYIFHVYAPGLEDNLRPLDVSWTIITFNIMFLDLVLSFCLALVIKGLSNSIELEQRSHKELEIQKNELQKAKELAENSLALKSEFLAQVSHEIRTPINTILSFISLIKADLGENSSEAITESFGMIENGSRRVIRTIDMILTMSELQAHTLEVHKQEFNPLVDVLNSLYYEFRQVASNKKLELSFENTAPEKIKIYADLYTVTQLFANLIDNAIKYTKVGSIKITSCIKKDDFVVEISDTGIGMSEEFQAELFKPFTQEETGYTRRFEGTGLGLSLVKSYCDINKCIIEVESKKNVGTKFIVKFKAIIN